MAFEPPRWPAAAAVVAAAREAAAAAAAVAGVAEVAAIHLAAATSSLFSTTPAGLPPLAVMYALRALTPKDSTAAAPAGMTGREQEVAPALARLAQIAA